MSIAESVLRFAEVSVPDQKHNLDDIKKIVDLFDLSELVEFVRQIQSDDIQYDEYADKVVDYMSSTLPVNHPFSVLDYHYINMLLVIIGYAIKEEEESETDDPKPEVVEEQAE